MPRNESWRLVHSKLRGLVGTEHHNSLQRRLDELERICGDASEPGGRHGLTVTLQQRVAYIEGRDGGAQ